MAGAVVQQELSVVELETIRRKKIMFAAKDNLSAAKQKYEKNQKMIPADQKIRYAKAFEKLEKEINQYALYYISCVLGNSFVFFSNVEEGFAFIDRYISDHKDDLLNTLSKEGMEPFEKKLATCQQEVFNHVVFKLHGSFYTELML